MIKLAIVLFEPCILSHTLSLNELTIYLLASDTHPPVFKASLPLTTIIEFFYLFVSCSFLESLQLAELTQRNHQIKDLSDKYSKECEVRTEVEAERDTLTQQLVQKLFCIQFEYNTVCMFR